MMYQVLHPCNLLTSSHMKIFLLCFILFIFFDLGLLSATPDDQLLCLHFTGSNLIVNDTAIVTSNGLLEVTNRALTSKGHAFYPTPLHFHDSHNGTVPLLEKLSFVPGAGLVPPGRY